MKPSLFYTSTVQTSDNNYLEFREYNSSYGINSTLRHSLAIVLPDYLVESELQTSIPIPDITTDFDYFENNLAAPREEFLRMEEGYPDKEFYRNHSNDLATGASTGIYEHTFTDYVEVLYTYEGKSYQIKIGLPVKENIFNIYVDTVLSDPTTTHFRLTSTFSPTINNIAVIDENYAINTINLENELINNNYFLTNGLDNTVVIEDLPPTAVTVNLYIGNTLVTSTSSTITLEYIPRIDFNLNYTTLREIAISLYNLKQTRPDDWVFLADSILTKLFDFIQEGYYIPPSQIYFDDNLNEIPQEYSYYDLAFLTAAVFNIYDTEFTSSASKFVQEATFRLASSINVFTGLCNKTISINLIPLIDNDLDTTVLVNFVLSKYLIYRYDSRVEYLLGIIYGAIQNLFANPDLLETELPLASVNKLDTFFHLLLWARVYNQTDAQFVRNRIGAFLAEADDDLDINIRTLYTIKIFEELGILDGIDPNDWLYTDLLESDLEGSWGVIGQDTTAYYSSWVYILENYVPLWPIGELYYANTVKANAFLNLFYRRSLGNLPIGEPWFAVESLEPSQGVIGCIVKATNTTMYPFCYNLACLYESLNLDNAYGVGLDRWGELFDLPRFGLNETDDIYRQRLITYSNLESLTYTQINNYVNSFKKNASTSVDNFLPTEIFYENAVYTYTDFEDLISKAVDNEVQLPDGTFFNLVEDLGVVKITSFESEELNHMIVILDTLFGLPLELKNSQSYNIELEANRVFF